MIDPFIAQNPKYPKSYVLPEKIDYVLLTHGHGDHIARCCPGRDEARVDGGGDLRARGLYRE